MDYLHTLAKFKDKLITFRLQDTQSVRNGRLIKYDNFGITVELYVMRGAPPEKFFPWSNISDIEACSWKDTEVK